MVMRHVGHWRLFQQIAEEHDIVSSAVPPIKMPIIKANETMVRDGDFNFLNRSRNFNFQMYSKFLTPNSEK